jgi:hypothetical protein
LVRPLSVSGDFAALFLRERKGAKRSGHQVVAVVFLRRQSCEKVPRGEYGTA